MLFSVVGAFVHAGHLWLSTWLHWPLHGVSLCCIAQVNRLLVGKYSRCSNCPCTCITNIASLTSLNGWRIGRIVIMKRVCDCSSISSILNSLAANLLVDFVSPIHLHCTRKPIRDGTALLIAKSACEKRSLYMCNVQKHEGIVLMPTMFSCKSDYFSEMLYPQIAAAMPPPPPGDHQLCQHFLILQQ